MCSHLRTSNVLVYANSHGTDTSVAVQGDGREIRGRLLRELLTESQAYGNCAALAVRALQM